VVVVSYLVGMGIQLDSDGSGLNVPDADDVVGRNGSHHVVSQRMENDDGNPVRVLGHFQHFGRLVGRFHQDSGVSVAIHFPKANPSVIASCAREKSIKK
jgi:hypothetical protein